MLSCRDLVRDADLLLAAELPWQRRIAVKLHLLVCHHCRRYLRQLRALTGAVPFMHGKASGEEVTKIMDHVCSGKSRKP